MDDNQKEILKLCAKIYDDNQKFHDTLDSAIDYVNENTNTKLCKKCAKEMGIYVEFDHLGKLYICTNTECNKWIKMIKET